MNVYKKKLQNSKWSERMRSCNGELKKGSINDRNHFLFSFFFPFEIIFCFKFACDFWTERILKF